METNILMGKYYKTPWGIFKAELCVFCNGRKVKKYHECMLRGRGMVNIPGHMPYLSCTTSDKLEEASDNEWVAQEVAKNY